MVTHKVPGTKKTLKTKAGTQIIDRAWRFLQDRIHVNQKCAVGPKTLKAMLCSAQYESWHSGADLWVAAGKLCSWFLNGPIRK